MSAGTLRTTLDRLEAPSHTKSSLVRLLRDVYGLFERLQNVKNVALLTRALLASPLWVSQPAMDLSYAVTDASRHLSADRATELRRTILASSTAPGGMDGPWRRAIFLSSMSASEMRDHDGTPSLLSGKGYYASAYVRELNRATDIAALDSAAKAGLLISMSWVLPTLTRHQASRISDRAVLVLVKGLYDSSLAFRGTPEGVRGFKELGLMTRTVADLVSQQARPRVAVETSECLTDFVTRLHIETGNSDTDAYLKTTFLSVTTTLQALLSSAARSHLRDEVKVEVATNSLIILRRLQGIHADSSVFEPWRFCFHMSLDMLADAGDALATHVDNFLDVSPFARNPLSTRNKLLFSKQKDSEDVRWLLTIIETSAKSVQSLDTLKRVFTFCMSALVSSEKSTKEDVELLHAVILSLIALRPKEFRLHIRPYIGHVLASLQSITDRQVTLIFKSTYRASFRGTETMGEEDPRGVLASLRSTVKTSRDVRERLLLAATLIELLPIVPAPYLRHNLRGVDNLLASDDDLRPLASRFVEVCKTEMDSERAMVCLHYLLSRTALDGKVEERARL